MRHLSFLIAMSIVDLVGCARDPLDTGNPDLDQLHLQAVQQANAMRGKQYVFVAPAQVCPDRSAFITRLMGSGCRTISAGRFTVDDVALTRDGKTLIHVTGDGIDGFMRYEIFLPQPYQSVQGYFATGKPE